MPGHGGRRVAGDGKRLGAPTAAERLSKAASTGTPSVASFFGGKPAARSEEVGSPREREPGGTPTKEQVTRAKREAPTQPGAEPLEQETAIGAGSPASRDDDHDYSSSEVVYSHTVTKAQRDADLRAAAVKVEDDDDGVGGSANSDPKPAQPPRSPPLTPKKEPSDSARRAARPPASRTEAAEMPSLLGAFLEGVDGALRSAVTMLEDRVKCASRAWKSTFTSEVNLLKSDLCHEIATLRKDSVSAARAVLDDVKVQRKELLEERKEFSKTKKLASEREWLVMLGTGNYICVYCDTHHHQLRGQGCGRFMESPFLRRNGGVKYCTEFSIKVCKHEQTKMHAACWALEEDREADPLLHAFGRAEHAADVVTARVFRTVLDSLKHYRSFLEHEALCFLQHKNGVELGERLHGRKTASTMLETIYAVRHRLAVVLPPS